MYYAARTLLKHIVMRNARGNDEFDTLHLLSFLMHFNDIKFLRETRRFCVRKLGCAGGIALCLLFCLVWWPEKEDQKQEESHKWAKNAGFVDSQNAGSKDLRSLFLRG